MIFKCWIALIVLQGGWDEGVGLIIEAGGGGGVGLLYERDSPWVSRVWHLCISESSFVQSCTTGFSIEGGTRRLIAAYFGIYSRLLCV